MAGPQACSRIAHMGADSTSIGRRIAEARHRAGLTQNDLAALIEMDRSSLAKVETGDRRVTAIELARVAAALSTRIEWFIDRTPNAIVSHRNATDPGEPSPRIDTEVERRVHAAEFVAQHDAEFKQTLTT